MPPKLTLFTKITAIGLAAVAIALWTQWLSGDPAYPKFPPGPVLFLAVAALVVAARRWWWTPLFAALIALLTTSGWFARLPAEMQRLTHPGSLGGFAAGIFAGTLLQIVALLVTDIAAVSATIQNFRRSGKSADLARVACAFFGAIFVLMGLLVIIGNSHVDRYHNLMHLAWGTLALTAAFLGTKAAERYAIASGAFYLTLSVLGFVLGDASAGRAWHLGPMHLNSGDHVFHLVLGAIFLAIGWVQGRARHSLRVSQVSH